MMENTWYTVISPESCSSILWRSWDKKETAAEQLRLTATDMKGFGLVDEIVPEPLGGAHWNYQEAADHLKECILRNLAMVRSLPPAERIQLRIEKYGKMGFWEETTPSN
jgi:acetyl-CoA carboxylase carboxyl transferase subunit alpha